MIRILGGLAAGIAIAIVLMMGVEAIGTRLFPPPALDFNDPDAPAALPFVNQLFPVIGWFAATLIGGWFAIQVSLREWTAWLVAASVLVGEFIDYMMGDHDAWVMIAGVIVPIVAAWIAAKLPSRHRRRASA